MIRDTCVCGAEYTSSLEDAMAERYDHLNWLTMHKVCRADEAERKRVMFAGGNRFGRSAWKELLRRAAL